MSINLKGQSGYDRQILISEFAKALGKVMRDELDRITRTCINCERFDQANELCGIYSARPPAAVIVIGCERHKEIDDIPF